MASDKYLRRFERIKNKDERTEFFKKARSSYKDAKRASSPSDLDKAKAVLERGKERKLDASEIGYVLGVANRNLKLEIPVDQEGKMLKGEAWYYTDYILGGGQTL